MKLIFVLFCIYAILIDHTICGEDDEGSAAGPLSQQPEEIFTTAKLFKTIATEIKDRYYIPLGQAIVPSELESEFKIRQRRATPLQDVIIDQIYGKRRTTTTPKPNTNNQTSQSDNTNSNNNNNNDNNNNNNDQTKVQHVFNNPHFFPNRSGIVHLFEWKFLDVANECEIYLGPKGFAGVQVSPVTENLVMPGRPWYERYQPISYQINTRSGDSADFLEMTSRCHNAGIRIYVDVVPNHMSGNFKGTAFGTDGTYANPDSFYYPGVPFTKEDFHEPCAVTDMNDPIIARNCELVGLHDLDHSRENVRWAVILLLNKLIALGAAGFRVDASKHMWPDDLRYIYERVINLPTDFGYPENTRPFIYQEVGDGWKFNYTHLGAVTEFAHPINMADIFKHKKDVTMLEHYGGPQMGMLESQYSFTFVDNHDLQRQNPYVLTYKNAKEFKAAYVFTLGYPYGIPRVMSSFAFDSDQEGPPADIDEDIISPEFDENEQCVNGWVCEHRWNAITNMIEFRNLVNNEPLRKWWSDGEGVFGFCRGNKGYVFINTGRKDYSGIIRTCLPKGTYCDIISGKLDKNTGKCTNKTIHIDGSGKARIELLKSDDEAAIALHINAKET